MGIVWMDGFDYYDTNVPLTTRYTFTANNFNTSQAGRFGGRALSNPFGDTCRMTHPVSPALASLSWGFAVKINSAGTSNRQLLYLKSGSGSTLQCTLWIRGSDKKLVLTRGSDIATNILAETTNSLVNNTWHYFGMEFTRHASTGAVNLYLDGSLEDSATGLNSGSADIDIVEIETFSTNAVLIDDYYVVSGATWLGERKIETLYVTADTAQKDWTADTGTDNYARVDEPQMDGDSSYVFASTVGDEDLYTLGDLSTTPSTIDAVQVAFAGRKDDATSRTVAPVLVSGATTDVGTDKAMAAGYSVGIELYETDPATTAAWTAAAVNALNVGIRVTT